YRFRPCTCIDVQLHQDHSAAAVQRLSPIADVRDERFQGANKKRTNPPLLSVGARVCASLDHVGEKALSQILRILRSMSLLAYEGVQRAPIDLAQFRQRIESVNGCRR